MKKKNVSIIIPVYNEKNTIQEILAMVEEVDIGSDKEVIIIDDGSDDGTTEFLRSLDRHRYKVILKERNGGKGAALKSGIAIAAGEYIIFQDADLEYNPKDYGALLLPLEQGRADLVIGSRIVTLSGLHRAHWSSWFNQKAVAFLMNVLYLRRGTDYYGCYKAFRKETLTNVTVKANRFAFDAELLCKLFKKGVRAIEVPTSYVPRTRAAGKKIAWRDEFAVIGSIIWYRFFD